MVKRWVVACSVLSITFVVIALVCWYLAFDLEPVFRGARMPGAREVASPLAPMSLLWLWSQGVEHASRYRMPAAMTFVIVVAMMITFVVCTLSWSAPFPTRHARAWW
jgi:hypothetical protein